MTKWYNTINTMYSMHGVTPSLSMSFHVLKGIAKEYAIMGWLMVCHY